LKKIENPWKIIFPIELTVGIIAVIGICLHEGVAIFSRKGLIVILVGLSIFMFIPVLSFLMDCINKRRMKKS